MAKRKKSQGEVEKAKRVQVQYDPSIVKKNLIGGMGEIEPLDGYDDDDVDVVALGQKDPYGTLRPLPMVKGPRKGPNDNLLPGRYEIEARAPKGPAGSGEEHKLKVIRQDN